MRRNSSISKALRPLCLLLAGSLFAAGCSGTLPLPRPNWSEAGADDDPEYVLYLIGDAGDYDGSRRVLRQVRQDIMAMARSDAPPVEMGIVFLGDNVYPEGLRIDNRQDRRALNAQLEILRGLPVRGWFIPGNHDWAKGKPEGLPRILAQGAYIDSVARASSRQIQAELLPRQARPGPAVRSLGDAATIVFLDSQWWLHTNSRGAARDSLDSMKAAFSDSLRGLLTAAGNRPVVVVAHHPLQTSGVHENNTWYDRFRVARHQDTNDRIYREFIGGIREVFQEFENNPVVYAAGHDHNLQVFDGGPDFVSGISVVSGSGSKLAPVDSDPDLLFYAGKARREKGFMKLNFYNDGSTRLLVFTDGTSETGTGRNEGRALLRYMWTKKNPAASRQRGSVSTSWAD